MDELLGGGFWHSLMGLLAHKGQATIGRVIDLAAKQPFSVKLETADARRILNLGKLAKTAARLWHDSGNMPGQTIPTVSLPPVPNLYGGKPGKIQASLILKPEREGLPPTNIVFSVDELTPFQKALFNVQSFINEYCGKNRPKSMPMEVCEELKNVEENWLYGRKDAVIPSWLAYTDRYLEE